MDQIHNKLLGSSQAYSDWHDHPHHKKVHWGLVIVAVVVVGLLLFKGIENWRSTIYNFVVIEFSPRTATLTLDPKTKSVKVGDSFAVNVILDTTGKPIDGVDIYTLHYDPTILSVVDDVSTKAGVQITSGTLMGTTAVNSVDATTGTIKYSQAVEPGTSYTGKGVLATIHFKAVGEGNTYLKFDFKLGSTKDTNVAHGGRDQLLNVVDALFTVTK